MRNIAIPFTLILSNFLIACADGGTLPPPPPSPLTISITDQAPALVAFRDGLDAPWQAATMKSPTSYEAIVDDSYVVTVVCEDPATGRSSTLQVAGAFDDKKDLTLSCGLPATTPSGHAITGHMVQAGFVQLGSSSASSETADWNFQLSAADGSYDLIAETAERIQVLRAIKIDGDLVMKPIDVAAEGTALAGVAFTASNATQDETLAGSVDLTTPAMLLPARIYVGPAATAKAVRNSMLMPGDTQSASVRAVSGTASRELRRPFRDGDSTEYTLPQPLGGVQWVVENDQLSTSWRTLPELDHLEMSVISSAADGTTIAKHDLDMSPKFLAATGITHITIDTEIPGYKPEWRIDFMGAYTRDLTATHTLNGELASSSVTEDVNAPETSSRSMPRASHAVR